MASQSEGPVDSSLRGKVCVVTGATSGIGLVTARELARRGARLAVVGRNPAKAAAVVEQIRAATGNREVEAFLADLSLQHQVRNLARQLQERYDRLDVLVNNAGGIWLKRKLTAEGLEMTFAVNHLAYFLLTELLLDRLRTSAPARVVNVASDAHRKATLDFSNLQGEHGYNGWRQYCRTKLMNVLFTYELARRLAGTGVTANAVHPGWVATNFGGNNGWRGRLWHLVTRSFALSPTEGARTVIELAAAPELEGVSGRYFVRQRAVDSSAASHDQAAADRLWQVSHDLITAAPVGP